jgi:capsular polysaccharide transport system permease protein
MTNPTSDGATPKPRPDLRAVETGPTPEEAKGSETAPPAAPEAEARTPGDETGATPARRRRRAATKAAETAGTPRRTRAKAAPKTATPRLRSNTAAKTARKTAKTTARAAEASRRAPAKRAPAAPKRPRAATARRAPRARISPAQAEAAALAAATAAPEVRQARLAPRHWLMALSFVVMVLLPFAATTAYLYIRAANEYHSEVAFSIRSEEANSAAAGVLGAITSLGTGSASDSDILFEYVRSQGIVEAVDADLDLRTIYNRATGDPIFTLGENAAIEDLVAHWQRMVDVAFDSGAGIIHLTTKAFTPEDATAISTEILRQSSALVNQLSEQSREDAVRFAREEFAEAEENLRMMRQRLSEFRRENRIVDPSGDVAGQTGLLNALQSELAQALVERDMLLSYADAEDQRVLQANRRIDAVEGRIEAERASLGVSGTEGALPDVVGRYEELLVDLEFANTAYTQTLGGLAAARAEARRQSRYLAPHIEPTTADKALYPRRALLSGLTGLFLVLAWGAVMLIYYNVRDNR